MFTYLQCPAHLLPQDLLIKDNQIYMVLCSGCLNQQHYQDCHIEGIRLNSRTLNLFTIFTTYVENKLREWCHSVKKAGTNIMFQQIVHGHRLVLEKQCRQKINQTAVEVIKQYRHLIRSNRQCVSTNPNTDILYHPEFLKDIYNLVFEDWKTSSFVIQNNFKQRIDQILPQQHSSQYHIKTYLVAQINREKQRIVGQFAKDVVVTIKPKQREIKEKAVSLQQLGHHCNEVGIEAETNQSESHEERQQGIFDTPLLIKKVDSFLQIKQQLQSNKQIDGNGEIRRNKMKNSKLIDEEDYYQWKAKFLQNLHQIETLKHQNQRLVNENGFLSNEKSSLQEDNQILRKKYEKLLHDSKQRLTSGKKQNQNADPNSQLLLTIVELEVEINDSRHDLNLLAGCLNELIKASVVSRESITKKLKALRTIHIHN